MHVGNNYCLAAVIDKMTGTFSSAGAGWEAITSSRRTVAHASDPSLYIFAAHDAGATKMSAYRITYPYAIWRAIAPIRSALTCPQP